AALGHLHDRRQEQDEALLLDDVDADGGGAARDLSKPVLIERIDRYADQLGEPMDVLCHALDVGHSGPPPSIIPRSRISVTDDRVGGSCDGRAAAAWACAGPAGSGRGAAGAAPGS